MPQALVRKRCFVQMIGYEPVGAEHQHRRFIREMARFQKAWNVSGSVSPLSVVGRRRGGELDGRDLRAELARRHRLSLVPLGRLRVGRRAESDWWRFPLGVAALMEFILTGTAVKYFIVAWRYGGFFLSPLIYILGMIWLSIGLTRLCRGPQRPAVFPVLRAAACVRALRGVAADLRPMLFISLRARRLVLRARLHSSRAAGDRGAARPLCAGIGAHRARDRRRRDHRRRPQPGRAALARRVVDRALQLDPELGRRGKAAASRFERLLAAQSRAASGRRLAARGRGTARESRSIYWVEFQALVDIINVYKVDPVVALGLPATGKPI